MFWKVHPLQKLSSLACKWGEVNVFKCQRTYASVSGKNISTFDGDVGENERCFEKTVHRYLTPFISRTASQTNQSPHLSKYSRNIVSQTNGTWWLSKVKKGSCTRNGHTTLSKENTHKIYARIPHQSTRQNTFVPFRKKFKHPTLKINLVILLNQLNIILDVSHTQVLLKF